MKYPPAVSFSHKTLAAPKVRPNVLPQVTRSLQHCKYAGCFYEFMFKYFSYWFEVAETQLKNVRVNKLFSHTDWSPEMF